MMLTGATRLSNFNPRSSCEERRVPERDAEGGFDISIHAPHARSDTRPLTPLR